MLENIALNIGTSAAWDAVKFIGSKVPLMNKHKVEVVSDKIAVTTDAVDRLFSDEDNDTNSFCIEVCNYSDKDILWTVESGYVHYNGNALKIIRHDETLKAQMKSVVEIEMETDFEYEYKSSDSNECVLYIRSEKQPIRLDVEDIRTTNTDTRRFSKYSLHDCYETVYCIDETSKDDIKAKIMNILRGKTSISVQDIIISDIVKGYTQYYQADVYLKVQVNNAMNSYDLNNLLFSKQYQAGIQTCTIKIER